MTTVGVVDDDPDIRELIAMRLSDSGYVVTTESDGRAGLAAAQATQPDLVVLDWMMPGLTGIDVCRALRGDPRTAETRVLMLTARARADDVQQGLDAGADDYLVKPFRVLELSRRVESVLARAR